jgi:hypothetical protein
MFLSVHVFSITCANIPQDRHQVPGRVDTRCRAAVRGQPIGRGGHRLSRWHLRPPACPQRCTTASGHRVACATACHPAGPCTARRAFASGPGSLAPSLRARDRCRRQTPARGLARFGRRPTGLPRSPPRRQRTTACRTFFIVSELQPMPLTCADTAPDSWSLPASVQGGSDGRITRSAGTLVQRQLPIRGYGHILNLASPRGCHAIAPALTAVHTIRMRGTFPAPCGQDAAQAHRAVERGIPGEVVLIVDDDLAAALEV